MTSKINNCNSKKEARWSFFLPISFLFVQYGYGLGNLMLTYCILFSVYCIVRHSDFPVFKPLSIYTLWYVFILLCTVLIFGHTSDRAYWVKLILILVSGYSVTIIAKYLDIDALYKCWKFIGLIVCATVVYQFYQTFFLHQNVSPIPLLPVSNEVLARSEGWVAISDRPVAFFTEPAMVIAFLTPVLLFSQQKKEFWLSVILSFSILLTGSTTGVIAILIMWGTYIYNNRKGNKAVIIWSVVFIIGFIAFINVSLFSNSLDKIFYELSGTSSNADARMWRGWWVFGSLDTRSQIFGISDYNISSYVYGNMSEFTWQTGYEDNYYLNTIQRILIQTGILGAILYLWMMIKVWLSTDKSIKPYFLLVFVSMFFASNFYINGLFVMQYIIVLSYLKEYNVHEVR